MSEMTRTLTAFGDELVDSRRRTLVGFVVGPPRLENRGGLDTFVVDVDVGNGEELLESVPIAPYAQQLRHADQGTPVRLAKSPSAGLWQVVGRAFEKVGNMEVRTYSLEGRGFLYTQGISLDDLGSPQTAAGNTFSPGTPASGTIGWVHAPLPYGDLTPYGILPYGAVKSTKITL